MSKPKYFVIDVHCHVADPDLPARIAERGANDARVRAVFESFEGLQKNVGWNKGTLALGATPQSFPTLMKKAGVDMAVFAMLGFSEELGGIEISSSEFLAGVLAASSGKQFKAYAGVDPRLPDSEKRRLVTHYVKEKGFVGIKVNPNDWGTFPLDDARVMPIYETCAELDVPLHVHTGVDPAPGVLANANPMLLEGVAKRWPSLKLLLEHYGFPWKYEAYALCRRYPNVYLTLAWHFNDLVHHNRFLAWQELEEMRIHAGLEKILYGSDFPASPNVKEVVDFLKHAPVPRVLRKAGFPEWTHEMRARVLGMNAAKVLGITNPTVEALEARFEKNVAPGPSLPWDPDALERTLSIPSFVREKAMRQIELRAKQKGCRRITVAVMEDTRHAH